VGVVGATGVREISRGMVSERASQRAFFGVSALLFTASATLTIVWCASMSAPLARHIDRAQVRAWRDRPKTELTTQTNKEI
jgi:hypothetical protein